MHGIEAYMILNNKKCIAAVGGGGKTSLLHFLAEKFSKEGKRVVLSTTTHMGYDPERPFAEWGDWQKLQKNIELYGYTVTGILPEYGNDLKEGLLSAKSDGRGPVKFTSPPDACWKDIMAMCDVLLLEADGAKRLPIKVPADHEPVIPDEADLVIAVAGLDCLGKRMQDICHRPHLASALLGKSENDILTEEDVAVICTSDKGLRKGVGDRAYLVLLNKADTVHLRNQAMRIEHMMGGVQTVITSLQRKKISIILLAAGDSRRFGTENKLLHKIEGKPMFQHCLDKMSVLGCRDITVITQFDEIADIARSAGAKVLYNPHPQEGISSSVKIGLKANLNSEAWMFAVCDQPWLTLETLEGLINCYFLSGKGIAAVSSGGKIGNPCIFSSKYKDELLQLVRDVGGKHVIVNHRDDTAVYQLEDEKELEDIDYKAGDSKSAN